MVEEPGRAAVSNRNPEHRHEDHRCRRSTEAPTSEGQDCPTIGRFNGASQNIEGSYASNRERHAAPTELHKKERPLQQASITRATRMGNVPQRSARQI